MVLGIIFSLAFLHELARLGFAVSLLAGFEWSAFSADATL